MKALLSSMAGLALMASGAAWAGETGGSQGSQAQKPHKSSETYGPQESGETDPGGTGGQTSQSKAKQTTGQESEKSSYFDDAMITTKVKAALAQDSGTSAIKISVETNDQTVQLTGSVQSEDEKKKAESIARGVAGVKEVENKLAVK